MASQSTYLYRLEAWRMGSGSSLIFLPHHILCPQVKFITEFCPHPTLPLKRELIIRAKESGLGIAALKLLL